MNVSGTHHCDYYDQVMAWPSTECICEHHPAPPAGARVVLGDELAVERPAPASVIVAKKLPLGDEINWDAYDEAPYPPEGR